MERIELITNICEINFIYYLLNLMKFKMKHNYESFLENKIIYVYYMYMLLG